MSKPRMKHRTVGPRKGNGASPVTPPLRENLRKTGMDADTYEFFMKHGYIPKEEGTSTFTLRDFLRKR
ncbi:MAG: hypothetical protein ABWY25_06745 [Paenisporosarcina sp.]